MAVCNLWILALKNLLKTVRWWFSILISRIWFYEDAYPYEYINSFRRFSEENIPNKEYFYRSLKDGTTVDNDEKLNGHISDK